MRVLSFLFLVVFLIIVGGFAFQNRNHNVDVTVWDTTRTVSMPILVGATFLLGMLGGWTVVGMLKRSWQRVTEPDRR
jgi:hypothetical protein